MSGRMYVPFVEYNDNEGETWVFFLRRDGNEPALEKLAALLPTLQDPSEDLAFKLLYGIDHHQDEDTVDSMIDMDCMADLGDYMPLFNKVNGKLVIPKPGTPDDLFEDLYKGGIVGWFE